MAARTGGSPGTVWPEVLADTGLDATSVSYERVDTPEDAERRHFRGSPTILIEGEDPFADDDAPVGLSCRIYQTETGPAGAPSVRQLTDALRR